MRRCLYFWRPWWRQSAWLAFIYINSATTKKFPLNQRWQIALTLPCYPLPSPLQGQMYQSHSHYSAKTSAIDWRLTAVQFNQDGQAITFTQKCQTNGVIDGRTDQLNWMADEVNFLCLFSSPTLWTCGVMQSNPTLPTLGIRPAKQGRLHFSSAHKMHPLKEGSVLVVGAGT